MTTPQYEWIPEIDRTLLTGGRYRMAILAPRSWTSDQTQTYLEGKGWNVVSLGAPPADVAAILAGITNSGIPAPVGWWVIATWPGATGTVLPANDGSIAYATLDFYSEIPPGETAVGAAPAPTFSAGPAVAAFVGGAAVVGALAYLSKTGAFARGHAMANPIGFGVPMSTIPRFRANPLSLSKADLRALDMHALQDRLLDLERAQEETQDRLTRPVSPEQNLRLRNRLMAIDDDLAAARSILKTRLHLERIRR